MRRLINFWDLLFHSVFHNFLRNYFLFSKNYQQMAKRPDVIITDGKNPVAWYVNGLEGITETPNSQKIVDTTGAGDAFLAGFISQLISSGYPSNELEIQACLKFASVCGLLTCFGEGAIEQQPDYEKVNKFLGSLIL